MFTVGILGHQDLKVVFSWEDVLDIVPTTIHPYDWPHFTRSDWYLRAFIKWARS